MASPVLSTLHHVTERKLKKLATHRQKFETDKSAILTKVAASPDSQAKVQAILDGFELYGITARQPDLSIQNIKRFIHQSKHDPSVSASLVRDWQEKLEQELEIGSVKYEYAALFGNLVIEWIKYPNPAASVPSPAAVGSDTDSDAGGGFDAVGRKEMHEQRKTWEGYAFKEKKMDREKIKKYLQDIFRETEQVKTIKKSDLDNLREAMKHVMDFKSELRTPGEKDSDTVNITHRFTADKLKSCIRGLVSADLLAGKKREALLDLQSQPAVLAELVDVLNMDLDALDTWEWDPSPVPLNMRRQLNGKYRVYMDEETHQAILLQFIGQIWAAALKKAFMSFYHSGAWLQSPYRSMGKKARQRREYFIPSEVHSYSVRNKRRTEYQEKYFMTQLPDNDFDDDHRDYAAEDQDERELGSLKSPLATKQSMLRLITAEMLVNTKVYKEFTVLQSDFKWFGPSLPHDTLFTVLSFLGVPPKWLRFFEKFLSTPVIFAQDGPAAGTQVRKRGIPMSHILSDALSEAVLFCLDFAVNKRTQGANIYRFHDDLWFWGQESTCIQAWKAIKEFSEVTGLELNPDKTGSALIVAEGADARSPSASLPQGKIKWGFLVLDAKTRRWVVDRVQVDEHVEELRRQLGACRSIMAWVQAWNSYVSRFFLTNFGNPANCLGRQHNDMVIETFEHIQRRLFSDAGTANVTDYLRGMLKERFQTDHTVPDGFFYFPVELGGLGLRNPSISLFTTYKNPYKDPGEIIDFGFEIERAEYERLKERWDSGEGRPKDARLRAPLARDDSGNETEADEPFLSYEEYTRYREEASQRLYYAYTTLMDCPLEETVEVPLTLREAISERDLDDSNYWYWIYSLYCGDMKRRFGGEGLQLGERDLLPVGLVSVLKSEKVRWEG